MAIKSLYIDVHTLLKLVVAARDANGKPLIPVAIEPGARVVGAGYNGGREEITLNVEAKAFNEIPGQTDRQPQSYHVQIKK